MNNGIFTLPNVGNEGHTLVFAPSAKGKSLLPDNSELTMSLATKAFEMIGHDKFSVSASLSADNADSLRNFGLLQSILLMAFNEGLCQAKDAVAKKEGSRWVSTEAASECIDAIDALHIPGSKEPL